MRIITAITFFLLSGMAYAAEPSYTYIVYTSSFPYAQELVDLHKQARIDGYTNLEDQGHVSHHIPMMQTRQLTQKNTNYAILDVTPITAGQENLFAALEASGRIRLIQKNTYR